MTTPPRLQAKGCFYHIYNRGNRKAEIFLEDWDRKRFLERLGFYKDEFNMTLLTYCLMPNHFHFLFRQDSEESISRFMLSLLTSYAKYFNTKYDLVGRLFQGRFQSKIIDEEEYLLELSRYVHRNPLEIISLSNRFKLQEYRWSSYPEYLGLTTGKGLVDTNEILSYFSQKNPQMDYQTFVEEQEIDLDPLLPYLFENPEENSEVT